MMLWFVAWKLQEWSHLFLKWISDPQGEGHQLNFRHAKFEMPIRYPVVMHEGGRGYIRLEAKAQVGDL